MHKSKFTLLGLAIVGIISTFLPWRTVDIMGLFSSSFKGIDHWPGYVGVALMVGVLAFAAMGKPAEIIKTGVPKMGILVCAGLALIFGIYLEVRHGMNKFDTAGYGLHVFTAVSLACLVTPYLFRKDGSVSIPTKDQLVDDLEESADIVEDKFEDFADKIEDKVEEIEDKVEERLGLDDDDDEKDEKNDEAKEEE